MSELKSCMNKIFEEDPKESLNWSRYNANGKLDNKLSDKLSVAICVASRSIYKVKVGNDGKLYNPKKSSRFYKLDALDNATKRSQFKFREVNKICFDAYVRFLVTKHDNILLIAERELRVNSK